MTDDADISYGKISEPHKLPNLATNPPKKIIKILMDCIYKHHYKYDSRDEWSYHFTVGAEKQIKDVMIGAINRLQDRCYADRLRYEDFAREINQIIKDEL